MKKQDRLNDMLFKLFIGEVKVKDLASLYGVCERTIQNDIKELSQIYDIISPSRGVYKLKTLNEDIEKELDNTIFKMITKLNYDMFPQFEEYIQKIEHKLGIINNDTPLNTNFKVEKLNNIKDLKTIITQINWEYPIEFFYKNKKRIIQPLKIINYNSIWYVIGFDLKDNKLKSFKVNKISNMTLKMEKYLPENQIKNLKKELKNITTPWIDDTKKETLIRIYYPLSENVNEKIINKKEGYVEIKVEYFDEREVFEIVKKYIPYVKIMDKNLKEKMKELLKESMEFL